MPGGVRALAAARLPCRKDGSAPDPLEPAAAGGGSGAPAQVPTPCHLATRQLRVRPWPVHVARRVLRLRLLLQPTPTPSNLLDSECRAVKTAETATKVEPSQPNLMMVTSSWSHVPFSLCRAIESVSGRRGR